MAIDKEAVYQLIMGDSGYVKIVTAFSHKKAYAILHSKNGNYFQLPTCYLSV